MKAVFETDDILSRHAEMIANNRAKIIDGYVQLYLKKKPWWMPSAIYRFILSKVLVIAFFKEPTK